MINWRNSHELPPKTKRQWQNGTIQLKQQIYST